MWMISPGGWELMFHGVVFVTYNQQGGPRGEGKAESTNYFMFMEQHRLGSGTMLRRQMFSAESLTSPHPGFSSSFRRVKPIMGGHWSITSIRTTCLPNWLRGTRCPSTRKLPGFSMEDHRPSSRWARYMHRQWASENPEAPLGHHLQDSTHPSFGVVTTGFIFNFAKSALFKVEGSAFNGHEPKEERRSIQLALLDSSFRVSAAPTRSWTAQ
jgi:hypothetical protein